MMTKPGKKIVIVGTGGTIAGIADDANDNLGYAAAQIGIGQLVASLPGVQEVHLATEQLAQLDSKDMDFHVWRALAVRVAYLLAQDGVQAVVITHGTDTLEETAYFLARILQADKPVVLTCAMRPASSSSPDGPQNLRDALTVAQAEGARGVVVVCAGVVHEARLVRKVHPYRLDAFDSGEYGALGVVEESALRLLRAWPEQDWTYECDAIPMMPQASEWPWVEIVFSHTNATGAVVDMLSASGVDGIVVAGTGNGTIHQALEAALLRSQAQGVRVCRSTRCPQGRVLVKPGDALPDAKGLSPIAARTELVLQILRDRRMQSKAGPDRSS